VYSGGFGLGFRRISEGGRLHIDESRKEHAWWWIHTKLISLHNLRRHGEISKPYRAEKHHQLPVPSVYVVDTNGRIKFAYVNPD
jgi:hypothetical protein